MVIIPHKLLWLNVVFRHEFSAIQDQEENIIAYRTGLIKLL